jgi:hypothetical protein
MKNKRLRFISQWINSDHTRTYIISAEERREEERREEERPRTREIRKKKRKKYKKRCPS